MIRTLILVFVRCCKMLFPHPTFQSLGWKLPGSRNYEKPCTQRVIEWLNPRWNCWERGCKKHISHKHINILWGLEPVRISEIHVLPFKHVPVIYIVVSNEYVISMKLVNYKYDCLNMTSKEVESWGLSNQVHFNLIYQVWFWSKQVI